MISSVSKESTSSMAWPSQGTPARLASMEKSVWRSRKSTFSLPRPRISAPPRYSSSSVEVGESSMPMDSGPCFCAMSASACVT